MRMFWMRSLIVILLAGFPTILADEDEVTVEEEQPLEHEPVEEDIPYSTPRPIGNYYIAEHFDDREDFGHRWIISETKKEGAEDAIAKYNGKWEVEEAEKNSLSGDLGLVLKSKAHHHAISTRLDKPFLFDNKPFILQYEVRFQNGQECGGAYLKLLSQTPDLDLRNLHDKTPYTLMFGPDKCGNDHKLHFIFRHRNPKNGSFEEKHWKKSSNVPKLDDVFKDKKPHLFTLVFTPDNKFEVLVDKRSIQKGSLLEDFNPPVNPPAEIDDPNDHKPEDWDEREKIPDPNAKKPADWNEDAPRQIPDPNGRQPAGWLEDEPELIADPHAEKPSDWDDEMDGEWEPPLISNPKCEKVGCGTWKPQMIDNPEYKGKWRPPLIDNPNYKGKWKPQRIANPDFFEDNHPYKMTPIAAVGFELWSMSDGILFDNIIIVDDLYVAEQWAAETWALKKELVDREMDNVLVRLMKYTNKHPWLWAVYVVVIGLPVVLFISFCCTTSTTTTTTTTTTTSSSSSSSSQEKEQLGAHHKKTDEPTPDDPIPKKGEPVDLKSPVDDVDSNEKVEDIQDITNEFTEVDENQDDAEETQDTEEEEVIKEELEEIEGGGDNRRSPRRRRTRKE